MMTKKCKLCGEKKDVSFFNKNKAYKDGYYKHCKQCHYEVYGRDRHLKTTYGISLQEFNERTALLNHSCEVCRTPAVGSNKWNRLVVDHDHKTGEIRGFLCQPCNMALGSARDNPSVLRALADYLDKHNG